MRLLALGGTRFVGRAVVQEALARGWEVDAVHRGVTGAPPDGARSLTADRTDAGQLRAALGDRTWDVVLDTWALAPRVARTAADLLAGRVARAAYVSSRSVYRDSSPGRDESAPLWGGSRDADAELYPKDKRGGELAWLGAFPDALLLRAGLVLGPYEETSPGCPGGSTGSAGAVGSSHRDAPSARCSTSTPGTWRRSRWTASPPA